MDERSAIEADLMIEPLSIEAIRAKILSEDAQIVYDDAQHRYFWDDVEWPSVSKLLRPVTDAELAAIPREVLEQARQRGIAVHAAIDEYLSSDCMFDLSTGDTALYMAQVKRFMKEHRVVVIAHEVKLRNIVYGFAGRADLIAILDDEQVIRPVDWKVTYEVNASVALQLNDYESCLSSYQLPVAEGVVVHLQLDDYQLVPAGEIADRNLVTSTNRGLISVNTWKSKYRR